MDRVRRWTKRFSKQDPAPPGGEAIGAGHDGNGVPTDHVIDAPHKPNGNHPNGTGNGTGNGNSATFPRNSRLYQLPGATVENDIGRGFHQPQSSQQAPNGFSDGVTGVNAPTVGNGTQPTAPGYVNPQDNPHTWRPPPSQPIRQESMPAQLNSDRDEVLSPPPPQPNRRHTSDVVSNPTSQVYPVPGLGLSFGPGLSRTSSQQQAAQFQGNPRPAEGGGSAPPSRMRQPAPQPQYSARSSMDQQRPQFDHDGADWDRRRSFTVRRPDSYVEQPQPRDEPNGRRSLTMPRPDYPPSQVSDSGSNRRSFSIVRPQQRQDSFRMLYGHEGRRPDTGDGYGWRPPIKGQSPYPPFTGQFPPRHSRYPEHSSQRYPPGPYGSRHGPPQRPGPPPNAHPDWRPDTRHHASHRPRMSPPRADAPRQRPVSTSGRPSLPYAHDPLRTHPMDSSPIQRRDGNAQSELIMVPASPDLDRTDLLNYPIQTTPSKPETAAWCESQALPAENEDVSTLATTQDTSAPVTTASTNNSSRSSPYQPPTQNSRTSHPPLSKMEIRPTGLVRHNSQGSVTRKALPRGADAGVLTYKPPGSTVSLASTAGGASTDANVSTPNEQTPNHDAFEKRDSRILDPGTGQPVRDRRAGVSLYDKPMEDDAIVQLEDLINRKLRLPLEEDSPNTNSPTQEPFGFSRTEDKIYQSPSAIETAQMAFDPRASTLSVDGGVSVKDVPGPAMRHGRSMSEDTFRAPDELEAPARASSAQPLVQNGPRPNTAAGNSGPAETKSDMTSPPRPPKILHTPSPHQPSTPQNGALGNPTVLNAPGLSPLAPPRPESPQGPYKLDYARFSSQRDTIELSPVNLTSIMVHEARRLRLLEPPKHLETPTDAFLTASPAPAPRYFSSIPFRPLNSAAREIRLLTILPPQISTRINPPFPASNPLAINSSHLHLTMEHVPLPSVTFDPRTQGQDPPIRPRRRMPLPPGVPSPRFGTDPQQQRAAELNFRFQSYNWMSDQRRGALHNRMLDMIKNVGDYFPNKDTSRTFEDARDYLGTYVYTPLDTNRVLHSDLDFLVLSYTRDDDTPDSSLRPVILNGQEVLISPNLEAALRALREVPDVEFGVRVWVESLCVNPRDPAESSVEAQCFIGDIIKASRHVISWVAPDDPSPDPMATSDTDLAIDFITTCCQRLQPGSWTSADSSLRPMLREWLSNKEVVRSPLYRALVRFFGRGYWRRATTMRDVARGGLTRGWAVCGKRMVPTYDVAVWAYVVSGLIVEDGLGEERRTLYHAVQSTCAMCMLDSLDWSDMAGWDTETVLKSAVLTRDFLGAQEVATAQDLVKTLLSLLPPQISKLLPPTASTTASTSMPLAHAASLAFAIAKGARSPDWITDVPFRWRWPSWVPRPGDRRTPPIKFRPRKTYTAGGIAFPSIFEPVADVGPDMQLRLELDVEAVRIGRVIRAGAYTEPDNLSFPRHHRYGGASGLSDAVRACLNAKNKDAKGLTFLDMPFRDSIADILAQSSEPHLAEHEAVLELADRVTVAAASHSWDLWSHRLDAVLSHNTAWKKRGLPSPDPDDLAALTKAWLAGEVDEGLPTLLALDSGHVGSIELGGSCLDEEDEGGINADIDMTILPGMEVWVLIGCGWPVVLWDGGEKDRQQNNGEEHDEEGVRRFRCLGRVYVHGAMEGEALGMGVREMVRLV